MTGLNRFHLFGGEHKFVVLSMVTMELFLSTGHAQKRMAKQGSIWTPDPSASMPTVTYGKLLVPPFTILELLAFTLPAQPEYWAIKVRFDGRAAVGNLGVFYAYTNIRSLENVQLEPTH